ncbi:hypothetical protein [Coleofasciculus sp.]|uniref:hypothetical protein n=1 Tax=Coleofasciculus sp. TaxID=3100458 RepID=UPI0039F99FBB
MLRLIEFAITFRSEVGNKLRLGVKFGSCLFVGTPVAAGVRLYRCLIRYISQG